MLGLMQDESLSVPLLMDRMEYVFGHKEIVDVQGNGGPVRNLTYAQVANRVRRLATALDDLGVSQSARVATLTWNSLEHVELYLAVPSTGRILHTVNPRLFAGHVEYIMNDATPEVVFIAASLLDKWWNLLQSVESVRRIVVIDDAPDQAVPADPRIIRYEKLLTDSSPFFGDFFIEDDRTAASLCYTSGTTGNPKGVLYDHRSIILHALQLQLADSFAIQEADTILPMVPLFHVNAWGLVHAAIMSGASLVLPGAITDARGILSIIQDYRVTFSAAVTSVWSRCAQEEDLSAWDLSSVRAIVSGGGPIPAVLADKYLSAASIPLVGAWGLTETSPVVSNGRVVSAHRDADPVTKRDLNASAGVPIPLARIRVVNEAGERIAQDGSDFGQLQVAAPTAAKSYFGSTDQLDGFTEDGWLKTGDIATFDQFGYIRIVDRAKDLIKSGGEWIPSVQLEDAILEHPKVLEVSVVAVQDAKWGERPVAFIITAPGESLQPSDIKELLQDKVARWWIPEQINIVATFPRTATGKISKKSLRDQIGERFLAQ